MYWERLDAQSTFAYIPALEPVMGVYSLLQGEKAHTLCSERYGAEQVANWKAKYRFLFEIYHAIAPISPAGMLELLLDMPLCDFSLAGFRQTAAELPPAEFLHKYLSWNGSVQELQQAIADDEALDQIYRKVADDCPGFLGFSALIRQSKQYIHAFFAFAAELQNAATDDVFSALDEKVQFLKETIAAEVKEIGPFECSQLRMGKTFHNRGPYNEFYFLPSLLLPWRALRFFHAEGTAKRQILFLSLRDTERSQKDLLCSLKALSDGTRYRILTLLAQGTPMRGLDIANRLSLAPSTVSHHMDQLKEGGLITEEPVKNAKFFGICKPNVEALLRELEKDFKIGSRT